MSLNSGERQVAPDVSGIRRDHVARYEFALAHLKPGSKVADLACGVGYGADILARAGHKVTGVDINAEAIEYARQHYSAHSARFICAAADDVTLAGLDAVVCFETIEHVRDPLPMLRAFRKAAPKLIASVPNEAVFPFRNYAFHHRHYTRSEFAELLAAAGWKAVSWHGQEGPHSEVEPELEGRTLVVVAERAEEDVQMTGDRKRTPDHVVIIGLGPSSSAYVELVKRLGDRKVFADEVWAINAMGSVVQCDRVFHMDDLAIQEARAKLCPDSNIAHMVGWLKNHPGPIYTSRLRDGYPGLVEFPFQDVLNNGGFAYFNSTAAYAIAYAVHIGVKRISLFGLDYTLPNVHSGEQGRACCEFWLGIAMARGIEIFVPEQTTLMDACVADDLKHYGYDCVSVAITTDAENRAIVSFTPREKIPTAEEIERRYDHSQHTNNLMKRNGR